MTSSDDGPHTRTLLPEDEQPGGAVRRPRPLRSLLVILGVVALLITAIAMANRGGSGGGGSGNGGEAQPTAPTGERPVAHRADGVPAGFAHTEQGAQSAAANYAVALGSDGMFTADRRHEIVRAIADPSVLSKLQADLDGAYSEAFYTRLGLRKDGRAPEGMTFVSRTMPAGAKIASYAGNTATIEVWSTGLVGLAGEGSTKPVTANWFTVTLKLKWSYGDWKLTGSSQKDGPSPVDGDRVASGAAEIAGAVKNFGGFTYAR